MIDDKDISIIVQGPILKESLYSVTHNTTQLVCLQLKKIFPQSELILSTWEDEDTSDIVYDKLVLSKDPGATWFNYENFELLNNCNRLILSTLNGIKAASRPYVFKVRSDLYVFSKSFLNYFNKFTNFDDSIKFVKQRIIAFSLYSIKGHKTSLFTMERPFHISDWAYFGYKEDLLNLYDIPLTVEPEFSQWFLTRCKPFFDIEPHRLWRMPPEQYVTYNFFKKFIPIELKNTADTSNDNTLLSQYLLTNNFLVLDQTQFKLVSLKYMNFQLLFPPLLSTTAIFFHTWLEDYCKTTSLTRKITFKYKALAFFRKTIFFLMNKLLRSIDGKKRNISRLFAYYLKLTEVNKNISS